MGLWQMIILPLQWRRQQPPDRHSQGFYRQWERLPLLEKSVSWNINLHQIHTSLLNCECCLYLLTATLGVTDTLTIMNWLVCCQIRLQIWQTSRFCKFSLKLKTFSHQYLSLYISFKKEIIEHLIILVPSADTCPTIRWLDQYRRS